MLILIKTGIDLGLDVDLDLDSTIIRRHVNRRWRFDDLSA